MDGSGPTRIMDCRNVFDQFGFHMVDVISFHHDIMICAVGGTSFFQSLAIGKIDTADLLYN